jgi:hypothetical protein
MKSNILVMCMAGAALVVTAPALAKPGGGHGMGGGFGGGWGHEGGGSPHAYGVGRGNPHADTAPYGHGPHRGVGPNYGHNTCPPGLAAKHNGCLPPGQARKLYNIGQRIPTGYRFYTPWGNIPLAYRNQIPPIYPDSRYDYIYRNNSIYVVDPRTRLVTDIIALAL